MINIPQVRTIKTILEYYMHDFIPNNIKIIYLYCFIITLIDLICTCYGVYLIGYSFELNPFLKFIFSNAPLMFAGAFILIIKMASLIPLMKIETLNISKTNEKINASFRLILFDIYIISYSIIGFLCLNLIKILILR